MKANKIVAGALVVLGFGGVVGLGSGCGANRTHRNRTPGADPALDTVMMRDGDAPVQAMYGVPPPRFDPDRPIIERAAPLEGPDK